MEETLMIAYAEVRTILDILGKEYQEKIPNKVKKLFYNSNIKTNLSIYNTNNIENIQISRTALIIISILNLKYWEQNESNKQRLKEVYNNNEKQYQETINIYKQDDWLNRNKILNTQSKNSNVQTALIVKEKYTLFAKIKCFLKKVFHRK